MNFEKKWAIGDNPKLKGGYCVHGNPLFLIWHRPYLALMEQILLSNAKEIVDGWKADKDLSQQEKDEKRKDETALKNLRLPYWDFCRPFRETPGAPAGQFDYGLAPPVSVPYIMVRKPNNVKYELIKNPLYEYVFPETQIMDIAGDDSKTYREVLTHAKKGPGVDDKPIRTTRMAALTGGGSRHSIVTKNINMFITTTRDKLYKIFTSPDLAFQQVSTARTVHLPPGGGNVEESKDDDDIDSFEAVHDTYHVLLGGQKDFDVSTDGAMTNPYISAFDPAFWLLVGVHARTRREYTEC